MIEQPVGTTTNELFLDIDIAREKIKGLTQLQEFVHTAIEMAESLCSELLNEVFQWKK